MNKKSNFADQPFANRLQSILEAVIPSRQNPTYEKVLSIVNSLVTSGAIRKDEAAGVYDALLQRVSKYNSVNVQTNLERMVGDVKEAVAQKMRLGKENLGSLVALNAFLATQPANVERGQDNYTGFITALRLLVTEVPSTEVYQSGPSYYLQSSRNGVQTVNLTTAFENMRPLWGVHASSAERMSISSLLTPNTRLLLLLTSPFTDSVSVQRNSYLGYLLTLYREALGRTHLDERTLDEVTAVSRAMGDENIANLQATLNFLLTNRKKKAPTEFFLTKEEERILRYVQQIVSMKLMHDNVTPTEALDIAAASFEPSFYASNRPFLNKLMDYLHRAAIAVPDYFLNAVLNPKWLPPEGFYTGNFDMPASSQEGLAWEDIDGFVQSAPGYETLKGRFEDDDNRRSELTSKAISPPPSFQDGLNNQINSNEDYMDLVKKQDKDINRARETESLVDKMKRWKTYKQESAEQRQKVLHPKYHRDIRRHKSNQSSPYGAKPKHRPYNSNAVFFTDDKEESQQASGSGLEINPFFHLNTNPFAHLRPHGWYQ